MKKSIWWMGEKEIDILQVRITQYKNRISDINEAKSNAQMLRVLQNRENELKSQLAELNASYSQDPTLIHVLRLISHITPENCMIYSYEYSSSKDTQDENDTKKRKSKKNDESEKKGTVATIKLAYPDPPSDVEIIAFKFVVDLKESGFFSDVKIITQEYTKELGTFMFTVEAVLSNS